MWNIVMLLIFKLVYNVDLGISCWWRWRWWWCRLVWWGDWRREESFWRACSCCQGCWKEESWSVPFFNCEEYVSFYLKLVHCFQILVLMLEKKKKIVLHLQSVIFVGLLLFLSGKVINRVGCQTMGWWDWYEETWRSS